MKKSHVIRLRTTASPAGPGMLQRAQDLGETVLGMLPGVRQVKDAYDIAKGVYSLSKELWDYTRPVHNKSQAAQAAKAASSSALETHGTIFAGIGNAMPIDSHLGRKFHFEPIMDASLGAGIRLQGSQDLRMVSRVAGDAGCFEYSSRNQYPLSPLKLTDFISTIADRFATYRFRAVKIRYIPACPTTTAGTLRIGYTPDSSNVAYGALNYLSTQSLPHQMNMAVWQPAEMELNPVPAMFNCYFQYDVAASTASRRMTEQGMFVGNVNDDTLPAMHLGYLEIDYVIDLFNQGPSLNGMPTLLEPLIKLRTLRDGGTPQDVDAAIRELHRAVDSLRPNDAVVVERKEAIPALAVTPFRR